MAYTSNIPLSSLTPEERQFADRISEMAETADRRGIPKFSAFLDEREQAIARGAMRSSGANCGFWGGYPGAERAVCYALPDYLDPSDPELFPIQGLTLRYPRQFSLSHRDFLGALMNLRIKREAIGDILVGEGMAVIFLWEPVFQPVTAELVKVGRVGVTLTPGLPPELPLAHSFSEISGTVSSLRLDSVTALMIRQGRESAAKLIRSGAVTVNAAVADSVSRHVEAGDKISVRGYGKFMIQEIGAPTKKDRLHITCLKYI